MYNALEFFALQLGKSTPAFVRDIEFCIEFVRFRFKHFRSNVSLDLHCLQTNRSDASNALVKFSLLESMCLPRQRLQDQISHRSVGRLKEDQPTRSHPESKLSCGLITVQLL